MLLRLIGVCALPLSLSALAADAPTLAVSPGGHYLSYGGRTIALVGDSGTQCVTQDANLDCRRWIDDCAERGLTAVHVWAFLAPRQHVDSSVVEERYGYVYPGVMPWPRRADGPPAEDGLPRYDLTRFDEGVGPSHYWWRLRDLCAYARDRGLVVGITVFFGWPKHRADWAYHPLNERNGGPVRDDGAFITQAQSIEHPGAEVLAEEWSDAWPVAKRTQWIWERFAERLIGETQPLGNVFYVFMDEHSYSEGNCGDHFRDFFRRRGAIWCDWDERRSSVDLVMSPTLHASDRNVTVREGFEALPARPYVVLEGEPYLGDAVRESIWTTLLAGGHFLFHNDSGQETPRTGIMGYDPLVVGGDVGSERRDWLGHASRLLNREVRSLDAMAPHNEVCAGGACCLADPGREYVIYAPAGGELPLRLALPEGNWHASLHDPRSGEVTEAGSLGGGAVGVPLPDARDWVVLLRAEERTR